MRVLIEVEKHLVPRLAFVDFQKALEQRLKNARVDHIYTKILENIYKNTASTIKLHKKIKAIQINWIIKQDDFLASSWRCFQKDTLS